VQLRSCLPGTALAVSDMMGSHHRGKPHVAVCHVYNHDVGIHLLLLTAVPSATLHNGMWVIVFRIQQQYMDSTLAKQLCASISAYARKHHMECSICTWCSMTCAVQGVLTLVKCCGCIQPSSSRSTLVAGHASRCCIVCYHCCQEAESKLAVGIMKWCSAH
jgi:hypothetical protein